MWSGGYEQVPDLELATVAPAEPPAAADGPAVEREIGFSLLKVLDIKGRQFSLESVPRGCTVGEFKVLIEEVSEVPVRLQRLIYAGKVLGDDSQALEACSIREGTVVHLFQRPDRPQATGVPVSGGSGLGGGTVSPLHSSPGDGFPRAVPVATTRVLVDDQVVVEGLGPGDMQLMEATRRVKFFASLLLLLSGLNVVTFIMTLLNAAVDPPHGRAFWISIISELVVNSVGVAVAMDGLRGAATLNHNATSRYCFGLVFVGVSEIALEIYAAVHEHVVAGRHNDHPSDGDEVVNDAVEDVQDTDEGDDVTAAVILIGFASCIWLMCFVRAFQFRRILGETRGAEHNSSAEEDDEDEEEGTRR